MKKSTKRPTVGIACAVPFRLTGDGVEFCLITGRKSGRWGFPKGHVDKGETVNEAALSEAFEEAGLKGEIVGEPLMQYRYTKKGTRYSVVAVPMEVHASEDDWKESAERKRRWAAPAECRKLLDRSNLVKLLETAVGQLVAANS